MPTRKWWAFMVTGTGTIATSWVTTAGWDQEESVSTIGLVVAGSIAWLLPNDPNTSAS